MSVEAIEAKALTEEEVKKLVEKAISEGKEESKFILVLETWYRQGPAYVSERTFEIVHGEAEEIKLEEDCEPYPYRCFSKYAIIPKTVPVVVDVEERDDTVDPPIFAKEIFVFTKNGWKKIQVQ